MSSKRFRKKKQYSLYNAKICCILSCAQDILKDSLPVTRKIEDGFSHPNTSPTLEIVPHPTSSCCTMCLIYQLLKNGSAAVKDYNIGLEMLINDETSEALAMKVKMGRSREDVCLAYGLNLDGTPR